MTIPEPDRPTLPRLVAFSLKSVMISKEAVSRHLKSVNSKKAQGPDDVSPNLLKHCTEELTRSLVMIFRQCLLVKVWPSQWKEAKFTPVHKKKERSEPNNYRPISLLSVMSKSWRG